MKAALQYSSEVAEKLDIYERLIRKWSSRINLVSANTIPDVQTRHFFDSAQLFDLAGEWEGLWLDLGSGGGFPGMIIGMLVDRSTQAVELVESDVRKCAFLRAVSRETSLDVTVTHSRIEQLSGRKASIISARALAPLDRLFDYAFPHITQNTRLLFPKGKTWEEELASAKKAWKFDCIPHKSMTNEASVILEIGNLRHG